MKEEIDLEEEEDSEEEEVDSEVEEDSEEEEEVSEVEEEDSVEEESWEGDSDPEDLIWNQDNPLEEEVDLQEPEEILLEEKNKNNHISWWKMINLNNMIIIINQIKWLNKLIFNYLNSNILMMNYFFIIIFTKK